TARPMPRPAPVTSATSCCKLVPIPTSSWMSSRRVEPLIDRVPDANIDRVRAIVAVGLRDTRESRQERRQKMLRRSSSFRLLLAGLLVAVGLAGVASQSVAGQAADERIVPFTIKVPDAVLADLKARLARPR